MGMIKLIAIVVSITTGLAASDRLQEVPPEIKGTGGGYFLHKTIMIPEDQKLTRMGEDAASGSSRYLIVADGVGSWNKEAIDAGIYARHLVDGMQAHYAENPGADPYYNLYRQHLISNEKYIGSTTVTAIHIESSTRLRSINVGNSGYTLFHVDQVTKKLKLYFRSEEQMHDFNYPFQIGEKGSDPKEGEVKVHDDL